MTSTVALHGHWICPFWTRVEFTLAQRGIAFEMIGLPSSTALPKEFVLPQHMENCRSLTGRDRVESTAEQLEEFVGRFSAHPRIKNQERVDA